MSKLFDFDAFMQEQNEKKQPLVIKIYGKEENLPADLPAGVILKIIRLQRKGKKELSPELIFEMATIIFGEERFEGWLNKGMTIEQMETLISKVMSMYGKGDDEQEEGVEGEKKTP